MLALKVEINIDSKYRLQFSYSSQEQPRQQLGWQSPFLAAKDRIMIGEPGRKIIARTLAHLCDVEKKMTTILDLSVLWVTPSQEDNLVSSLSKLPSL